MQYGYFTMPLHPPGSDFTQTVEADLQQIVTLDQLGFHEAWIGEHFTAVWENIPAPDLFIANALGRTKQIKLGTGVACLPNHHPLMLAQRIAQLDHMAQGRFYFGIGSGGFPGDFELFKVDPKEGEHRGLTTDMIELVLKLWEDPSPGDYDHKFWQFTVPEPREEIGLWLHMKPYQQPHPPIAVAGVSPKSETLLMAGERGWMPMSINIVPSRILASHWDAVAEGAQRVGRAADRSTWRVARDVYVAESTEQARREVLEGVVARDWNGYFFPLLKHTRLLEILKVDPEMPDDDLNVEYMLDNIWIVGDPDEVARQVRQLYQDLGGFGVLLLMGHEWSPPGQWERSMNLFVNEVMPQLQDL